MNKEKEVKIGDRVVHPKGAVLTLNAQEATEKINGKPLREGKDGFVLVRTRSKLGHQKRP